jgi:hypothetical protein
MPGLNVWQSKAPPPAMTPADLGMTPDEAAKVSGLILVTPVGTRNYRYQYYPTGQNHCEDDLKKLLAQRSQTNETGSAPYCTDNPTAPPTTGHALLF